LKAVETRNIRKVYKAGEIEVEALSGVSLSLLEGDFILVSGPSGSGKTTLLNILGALDRPTSGSIQIFERDISSMSDDELSDLRLKTIGFVFQAYNLIPTLTAFENVEFPMVLSRMGQEARRAKADRLLELVDLQKRAGNKPDQLSGGEQQRIAVARALANDPKMILADEPTGNLDTKSSDRVFELLRKVNEELGVTIVAVSHDPRFMHHAKRGLIIEDGRITHQGPARSWAKGAE
jgi:putative ABC transport system ATP-binding protein